MTTRQKIKIAKRIYDSRGAINLIKKMSRYGVEKLKERSYYPVFTEYFHHKYGRGIDFLDEDWDTLVLLDACRYDEFESVSESITDLEGQLEYRISPARRTSEFVDATFKGRKLYDCIYTSANPHIFDVSDVFYHKIPLSNYWDEELNTVHPEDVTDNAIKAHEQHPNKRHIVHYIQPHMPPIGETRNRLEEKIDFELRGVPSPNDQEGIRYDLYTARRRGIISRTELLQAYRESLAIALESAARLANDVDGKMVVSSDHGEMLGDSIWPFPTDKYGHTSVPKTPELCKVPWFVMENGPRREIVEDEPIDSEELGTTEVEKRLQALGYK